MTDAARDTPYTKLSRSEVARRAGLAASRIVRDCPHCGRETRGAGPAARHRKACPRNPANIEQTLTSVELFAGAGGLALGVSAAGFEHLAVVEKDEIACSSLRHNTSTVAAMDGWPIHEIDAEKVDYRPWADRTTLLSAGAPCQPFSQGGKRKGDQDERNMFPEVFRAVRELRPEAVIIENVKGLVGKSAELYFDYIVEQLRHADVAALPGEDWKEHRLRLKSMSADNRAGRERLLRYEVSFQVLNAADLGLAQHRERVFIIAFRSDLGVRWLPVKPTHSRDALLYAQWVDGSYWEEHGLQRPSVPAKLKKRVAQLSLFDSPSTMRWRTVRDALRGLPEPEDEVEHPTIANHAGIPGARSYKGHTGSPLDLPAKTLKAGAHGVPGGENMLRKPDGAVRYFTIREMARLQGFPDEYNVRGAWTRAMRQLGNAVPVDLGRVVARQARELLEQARRIARVA
jgi:DNA (cytosine-5)-methyltransferase 1